MLLRYPKRTPSNRARLRRRQALCANRRCAQCGVPITCVRTTKRFCTALCRVRRWRGCPSQLRSHQRYIREQLARSDPRPTATSLAGYTVDFIARDDAVPLIERYEWLSNAGRTTIFVGLFSTQRELQGVVCFGYGPQGRIRELIGSPALCLERGACVHWAPQNAASFLISRAVRLVYRTSGIARFFAYADPEAGEIGAVYRASNWRYLGQGLNGKAGERRQRFCALPPGADPARPANWLTDRALRRRRLTFAKARRRGWIVAQRACKHVYTICVGKTGGNSR
jgi:hypothetical protein